MQQARIRRPQTGKVTCTEGNNLQALPAWIPKLKNTNRKIKSNLRVQKASWATPVVINNTHFSNTTTALNSALNYILLFSVLREIFKDGINSTYLPVNKYRTELLAISTL